MTEKKNDKSDGDAAKTAAPTDDKGNSNANPPATDNSEELKKTISAQGDAIRELQEAVVAASIISNTISSDPTLKANFDAALRKQYGVQDDKQNQNGNQNQDDKTDPTANTATAQIARDVKEVKDSNRDKTISEFEKDAGILNLPNEKRKEARAKIETYLNGFGWSVSTIPLTNLRDSLDKAYVGTIGIERAKEEGKVEALTAYRSNEKGVMGNFSGANIGSQEEEALSSQQQKWLKNLGVNPDKAKKVYEERNNEKTREKKVE